MRLLLFRAVLDVARLPIDGGPIAIHSHICGTVSSMATRDTVGISFDDNASFCCPTCRRSGVAKWCGELCARADSVGWRMRIGTTGVRPGARVTVCLHRPCGRQVTGHVLYLSVHECQSHPYGRGFYPAAWLSTAMMCRSHLCVKGAWGRARFLSSIAGGFPCPQGDVRGCDLYRH